MTKSNVFPLSHTVLYAKNWYKRTEDIFEDLKKILELDGYSAFNKRDVFQILVNKAENFDHHELKLRQVLEGIHPKVCWKVGYYTNECTWIKDFETYPEYNYITAVVYYILSILSSLETGRWCDVTPKFTKYPKNPKITTKRIIEQFNKKKAISGGFHSIT